MLLRGPRVNRAPQVLRVPKGRKANKARRDRRAPKVIKVAPGPKDLKGPRANKVHLGQRVLKAKQVRLVRPARQRRPAPPNQPACTRSEKTPVIPARTATFHVVLGRRWYQSHALAERSQSQQPVTSKQRHAAIVQDQRWRFVCAVNSRGRDPLDNPLDKMGRRPSRLLIAGGLSTAKMPGIWLCRAFYFVAALDGGILHKLLFSLIQMSMGSDLTTK